MSFPISSFHGLWLVPVLSTMLQPVAGKPIPARIPVQLTRSNWAVSKPATGAAAAAPPALASAVSPGQVTFAEAGYSDQSLQGLSSSATYYLRIPPTGTLQNGRLTLFLTPSQALMRAKSSVTIQVHGQPVLSLNLNQLTAGSPISVPLSPDSQQAGSPFVQVDVKTQLAISDDRCRDLENPALWLQVGRASSITYYAGANGGQRLNLSNCLPTKTAIVYPATASPVDIRLVSALYSRLSELRPGTVGLFPASHVPDSLRNLIVVGELTSLPARYRSRLTRQPQPHQGLFALEAATDRQPEVLFVTGSGPDGYAKTVDAVSNATILSSAFGNFLTINEARQEPLARSQSDRLSLAQLGGQPTMMQGIGSLRQLYSFRLSDFSEQPNEIETHLEARYSGLQAGDRGYLNLYINDVLFSSTSLDKSGLISVSPRLKRYLLKPFNTVQAEFRFFPGTNVCQNSLTSFFAQVDVQRSYVYSAAAYSSETLSFLQYPGAFQAKPLAVVVSKSQLAQAVPGVCELVRQLNQRPGRMLTIPPVYVSDSYKSADGENLLAILDRTDPLWTRLSKAPVQFDRDFRLYGDDRSKPLFAVSDSVSCGVAQIFREGSQSVLLLSLNGAVTAGVLQNTARHLTDQLSNQASNVLIAAGPNRYVFNLTEDNSSIDYYDRNDYVRDWWGRYNLYILGGLLVLILLAFAYVRSKVKVSQALFEN